MLFGNAQRLLSILRFKHAIAGAQEDVPGHGPHQRLVINHQDGFHSRPILARLALHTRRSFGGVLGISSKGKTGSPTPTDAGRVRTVVTGPFRGELA